LAFLLEKREKKMKKLIIIFSIFLFAISGTVCFAGDYGTSQRMGGTTFHNL
jgi:hypothetical protein